MYRDGQLEYKPEALWDEHDTSSEKRRHPCDASDVPGWSWLNRAVLVRAPPDAGPMVNGDVSIVVRWVYPCRQVLTQLPEALPETKKTAGHAAP